MFLLKKLLTALALPPAGPLLLSALGLLPGSDGLRAGRIAPNELLGRLVQRLS